MYSDQIPGRRSERPTIQLPDGVEMIPVSGALRIIVRWYETRSIDMDRFFWFFTIFWNMVLIPFVLVSIISGEYQILLFISLHLAIGIGLLYYMMARTFNRTEIQVGRKEISTSHGPIRLPLRKDHHIPSNQVLQLYVSDYVAGRVNGEARIAYNLFLIPRKGNEIKLLGGLDKDALLYVEQEIEHYLGLTDEAVEGEVSF